MWSYDLKYETYSFIAPCNGLQGAVAQYAANQNQEHLGETPSLFFHWVLLRVLHNRWANGFTSHPKDEAMFKCLA